MLRVLPAAVVAALLLCNVGAAAPVQPNDPVWAEQAALKKIGLPQIWELTTGDPSVVIATIDTGVNAIPDLAGALAPGWDFIENDDVPRDTDSHGTRVASVIAARGNDGIGMAGHCWGCRIMPIRVTAGGPVSPERIAAGIAYAVRHGARIINVSLSHGGPPDPVEAAAVRYAIDSGVIVIASAGNAGNELPQYPAAYPGVLSVGATDGDDALYFWSSRGPWVKLTAPGCHMVTDLRTPPGTLCGTSFTPAAVAGVAGLLLSRSAGLSAHQVTSALLQTARPIPGIVHGRIDPVAAFRFLGLAPQAAPTAAPVQADGSARTPAPAASTKRPAPARFLRQTVFETGTFKGGFRATFRVGKGPFEMQLLTQHSSSCTLSLRSAGELIVAFPAVRNLLSLSERVAAGRYTAEIRCRGARTRQYSLGVIGMFPRSGP